MVDKDLFVNSCDDEIANSDAEKFDRRNHYDWYIIDPESKSAQYWFVLI